MKNRTLIGLVLVVLVVLVTISLVKNLQGKTSKHIDSGISEHKKGNYQKAIEHYNEAIILDQDNPVPYNNRGLAFLKLNESDKAISDYNKALDLKPDYGEAYFNRGLAYYHSGGWSDAKLMGAFKKEPYEKSIQEFTKAIEVNPKNAETYYQRGLAYTRLIHYYNKPFKPDIAKLFENAQNDFNKALELDPEYVLAYAGLGNLYYRNGEHTKAIESYNNVLKNEGILLKRFGAKALAELYASRGRNYLCFQKKWPEAIADCKKAYEMEPSLAHAALIVAVAYLLSNDNEEALVWSDKTITSVKKYPENKDYPYLVWAYFARPAVAFRQGKIEEAVEGFRSLVDDYDSFFEGAAYRHLGLCYRKLGDEKASLEAFEKGLAWAEKSIKSGLSQKAAEGLCYLAQRFLAKAYAERANIYLALGRFDEAISDFETVDSMKPAYFAWADPHMGALIGLGMTYTKMGKNEAAKQWLEKALKTAEVREQTVTMKRVKKLLDSLG
jgi:tetratricopeptide (TPR) repeat protein